MNHLHATFLVLTLFWLPAAHAGNVVLEHDAEFIPLGQEVHYLEDVQGTLSFEAAKNTYTQGLFTQSSMDTPACINICFDVKLDISEATSRSISVERDASWFSMVDARLADANPSRFCAAPILAR